MSKKKYPWEDWEGFTPMYHGMVKVEGDVLEDILKSLAEAYNLDK